MSTTDISQQVSVNSKGKIFKIASTLKESLEYRLRRDGYVTGNDIPAEKNKTRKPVLATKYTVTEKGKKLLMAWHGFLEATQD